MPASMSVRVNYNRIPGIQAAAPADTDRALRALTELGVNYVKLSFGESPADPGGPPGVDTGALRASINSERVGNLHYVIQDGVEYGATLELARNYPFMQPMALWLETQVSAVFANFLSE